MLQALADKLGQTVEQLWPHAVRHTAIEGFGDCVALCVFIGMIIGVYVAIWKMTNKFNPDDSGSQEMKWVTRIISLLVVVFGVPICLFGIPGALAQALEPVGATVKALLP